jgi:tetratricopeptide (TPR) repeat protein
VDELTLSDVPVLEMPDVEANAFGNNLGKIVCTLDLAALARLDLVVDGKNGYAYLRPKSPNQGAAGSEAITDAVTGPDWTVANSVHLNEGSFLYSKAKFKIGKRDLDGAIADLDSIIAHSLDDDLAYADRGASRGQKGDIDGAIEDFNRALELNPSNALAYANRGGDRLEKGDLSGAIEDLGHAVELNPNDADSFANLGRIKQRMGNFAEALVDYDKAIELNPEGDSAHYWYFFRQLVQMQLKQAPNDFSATVAGWKDGWAKTIGQYLAGGIDETAVLTAAEKPGDEPVVGQHCEAFYYIGMMHLLKGDTTGARDSFQKCVATGQKDYDEYDFARAELARLDVGGNVSSP